MARHKKLTGNSKAPISAAFSYFQLVHVVACMLPLHAYDSPQTCTLKNYYTLLLLRCGCTTIYTALMWANSAGPGCAIQAGLPDAQETACFFALSACFKSRCTHAACTHCSLMCPMQQNGTETFYGTACLEVP
eukprot:1140933-Pelagomonas_calceolata.AAC.5